MCVPSSSDISRRSPMTEPAVQPPLGARAAVRRYAWVLARLVHRADYAALLPAMARWPLRLGYAAALARGWANAALKRDWRSMALGSRHVWRLSLLAAAELRTLGASGDPERWARQRFAVEARDEFEACLMDRRRWPELRCEFHPADAPRRMALAARHRGLILLTPHFDSFYLGIALLAQASGIRVNAMASDVPADPRVDRAVTAHFERKYRGLEQALNGGQVLNIEDGIRPFFRMLQRGDVLVVLADAPVRPGGAAMEVSFLGGSRALAGGAQRLAQHQDAQLGAFVCRHVGGPRYELHWCEPGSARDGQTLDRLYGFMGQAILSEPGRWWAMDMLPNLPMAHRTPAP